MDTVGRICLECGKENHVECINTITAQYGSSWSCSCPCMALRVVSNQLGPWHTVDPDTSRLAAIDNYARSGSQRRRVLYELDEAELKGRTDYELHAALDILRTAAGTRRDELRKLGLVEKTDDRRPTDTGCTAVVWRITPAGQFVAGRLRELEDE
jgi:hypothetical protein